MFIETNGIICGLRLHGEHGAVVRILTPEHGLLVGYVRGARSRAMRPVLIAANAVAARFSARNAEQMPSLTVELVESRAPLMGESLAAAGLDWTTALSAVTLPESHPYPMIHAALDGVIRAIEAAPSARRWAGALVQYERLILSSLGFGRAGDEAPSIEDWDALFAALQQNGRRLERDLLSGKRGEVLAARERLIERLKRAGA